MKLFYKLRVLVILIFLANTDALAQPCLNGWSYRLPFTVDNSTNGVALTDYQVQLTLTNTSVLVANGKMKPNGEDIRFLNASGDVLPYWIETGTFNTASTKIWVKVDHVAANATADIFMFYGNSAASPASNGDNTFELFDDFDDTVINGTKWSVCGAGGSTMTGGNLTITANAGEKFVLKAQQHVSSSVIIEADVVSLLNGRTFFGLLNTSDEGYGMNYEITGGLPQMLLRRFESGGGCFVHDDVILVANQTALSPGATTGIWSFAWLTGNNQYFEWPGMPSRQNRNDAAYIFPLNVHPTFGHLNQGLAAGNISLDWVRVRRYTPVVPNATVGTESVIINSVTASSGGDVCQGSTIQLFAVALPGASFSWTGPEGFSSNDQNPTRAGAAVNHSGTYTVTATVPSNCFSVQSQVQVTVSPTSVGGAVSSNITLCEGGNTGTLSLAGHTGNVIRWESSPTANGPWTTIANTTTSLSYSNLLENTHYRAVVKSGACVEAPSSSILATVQPVTATSNSPVCQGSNLQLFATSIPGATYAWTGPDGFNSSDQNPIRSGTLPAHSGIYTVTATLGNQCMGVTAQVNVTIAPSTVAGALVQATPACFGANTGTLELSGYTGNIVRWESSPTENGPWATISNTTDQLMYEDLLSSTYYRAVVKSAPCGEVNSNSVFIEIFKVTATSNHPICEDGILELFASSIPGATYLWTGTNGFTSNQQNPTIPDAESGPVTYTVTATLAGACTNATANVEVDVAPATVSGTASGDVSVCSGSNSGTVTLAGHVGNILRWESSLSPTGPWSAIAVTEPLVAYQDLTTTTWFRAIVKSGVCEPEISNLVKITVIKMEATATAEVCEDGTVSLFVTSLTNATYSWSGPDTFSSNDQNPTIPNATPAATGTYSVTINVPGGACNALVETVSVRVDAATNPGTLGGAALVCYASNSGTLTLTGHVGEIQRWENAPTPDGPWTKIQVTQNTLTYEDILDDTYFRVWVKSGVCAEEVSNTQLIEVSPTSVAGNLSPDVAVCASTNTGTIQLSNQVGNVVRWESAPSATGPWNPIVNTNTHLDYINLITTTYYRAVVQSFPCPEVITAPVKIQVDPVTVAGLLTGQATVCSLDNVGTLTLAGFTGSVVKWETAPTAEGPWATVDVTVPTIDYEDLQVTQLYRVVVKSGACETLRSNAQVITVDLPSISGNVLGSTTVCVDANSGLLRLNDYLGNVVRWEIKPDTVNALWQNLPNPALDSMIFSNVLLTSDIRAIVKRGVCPAEPSHPAKVTVRPLPIPEFSAEAVCLGNETIFVNSSSIPVGNIVKYEWNFDDGKGNTLESPKNLYLAPGLYNVSLKTTSNAGCVASKTNQVTVNALPVVSFFAENVCQRFPITFEPTASVAGGTIANLRWDLNDGNIITRNDRNPLVYLYDTAGFYNVSLRATTNAGCTTTVSREAIIFPRAVLNFTAASVFEGQVSEFYNNSTIAQGNLTYRWSFGDGNNSTAIIPKHTYASQGTYPVQLISLSSFGGCRDTLVQNYVVKSQVIARFSVGDVCLDYPAIFKNESSIVSGTLRYEWDFGDGFTSTLKDPSHTYEFPGKYKVRLRAISEKNSVDVIEKIVTIFPEPKSEFSWEDVCHEEAMSFKNLTQLWEEPMTYFWDFADGSTATDRNPKHTFPAHGDYKILLVTTTARGCIDSIYHTVTVHPAPVPNFEIPAVCHQFESKFDNRSTVALGTIRDHLWDFGNGLNSIVKDPIHIYQKPGEYTVKLRTITDKGCMREITKPAKVYILPEADFSVNNVCFREPSVFVNRSVSKEGQQTFLWEFADGNTSVITDPSHTYGLPGFYEVKLTATTQFGCIDSAFFETEVYALPTVVANNDTTVSRGFPAPLKVTGALNYFWEPSIGLDNQAIPDPIAVLLRDQRYVVFAVDENGCEGSDEVLITIINDFIVEPANVITPDGNGINDSWYIDNITAYEEAEVMVFNLWGQVVYQTKGYKNDWGGVFNTDILPAGNYYYTITSPEHTKVYKGTITLLRAR